MAAATLDGMTDYSTQAQVQRVTEEFGRKRARMFLAFAFIEGALLVGAVLTIYGMKLVEPRTGVWIMLVIVILGGIVMTAMILTQMRAQRQAIRDLGGAALPGPTDPTR